MDAAGAAIPDVAINPPNRYLPPDQRIGDASCDRLHFVKSKPPR
jgi:hypothetical protein